MEQAHFYFAISSEEDKFDAHKLKNDYNLMNLQAWNKGDSPESYPNLVFAKACLYYSKGKTRESLANMFTGSIMSRLIKLPLDLKKVLHFAVDVGSDEQSHGCYLDLDIIKQLAVLNAGFTFSAKLHFLSLQQNYPFTNAVPSLKTKPSGTTETIEKTGYAHLGFYSYHYSVDEITSKLGIKPNGRIFNHNDVRRNSGQPYGFTLWSLNSTLEDKAPINDHIESLVDSIHPYKNQIVKLGNDIDVTYGIGVTGQMFNEYDFDISANTILKLAEMRMTLDFDMYFLNSD